MLIFLTGMPASGKTTTGKLLAAELGYVFLDLDDLVVAAEKMAVAAIFSEKGEEYFRQAEATQLRKLQGAKNTVVATGGGTPCYHDNMMWMNSHGLTVFLSMPMYVLKERLQAEEAGRPLISKNKNRLLTWLNETLSYRLEFYQLSELIFSLENSTVKELAQLVREKEKEAG